MTHLDISDKLATKIAADRHDLVTSMPSDGQEILRRVVEGVFPLGLAEAVRTHPRHTETAAIVELIAMLTIAVEAKVTAS